MITPSWFKEFLKKLFWEEWYQEQEASLKEQIKNALEQYAQSEKKPLLTVSSEDIKNIDIWWHRIIAIVKICQIKVEWDLRTPSWFKEFLKKLFWEEWYQEQEASLKEQIKNALEQYAQSEKKPLLTVSSEDIKNIDIWWHRIIAIVKICQIEVEWDLRTPSWFKEFLKELFWEKWYQKQETLLKK